MQSGLQNMRSDSQLVHLMPHGRGDLTILAVAICTYAPNVLLSVPSRDLPRREDHRSLPRLLEKLQHLHQ